MKNITDKENFLESIKNEIKEKEPTRKKNSRKSFNFKINKKAIRIFLNVVLGMFTLLAFLAIWVLVSLSNIVPSNSETETLSSLLTNFNVEGNESLKTVLFLSENSDSLVAFATIFVGVAIALVFVVNFGLRKKEK